MSHTSRAYCIQNNGLKGFLVEQPAHFKNLSLRAKQINFYLEKERFEGKLKRNKGSIDMRIKGWKGAYIGEVNEKGDAHGMGQFINSDPSYEGTFFSNALDGYCKERYSHNVVKVGEMKEGEWDGKATVY